MALVPVYSTPPGLLSSFRARPYPGYAAQVTIPRVRAGQQHIASMHPIFMLRRQQDRWLDLLVTGLDNHGVALILPSICPPPFGLAPLKPVEQEKTAFAAILDPVALQRAIRLQRTTHNTILPIIVDSYR